MGRWVKSPPRFGLQHRESCPIALSREPVTRSNGSAGRLHGDQPSRAKLPLLVVTAPFGKTEAAAIWG